MERIRSASMSDAHQLPPPPAGFTPDLTKTPEENIRLFWDHLTSRNANFASHLQRGVTALTPLPEAANRKTSLRSEFHSQVAQHLDAPLANTGEA
jgi:hypothetical protein